MSGLDDTFRCEHFRCTLRFKACLARQSTTVRLRAGKEVVPLHLGYCASGKCEQGVAIAAEFPDVEAGQVILQQVGLSRRSSDRKCATESCLRSATTDGLCLLCAEPPASHQEPELRKESPVEEATMDEKPKRTCCDCGGTLRLDSTHDRCTACRAKGSVSKLCEQPDCRKRLRRGGHPSFCARHNPEKRTQPSAAEKRTQPSAAAPKRLGPSAPDVAHLPIDFLVACVDELVRRRAEIDAAVSRFAS